MTPTAPSAGWPSTAALEQPSPLLMTGAKNRRSGIVPPDLPTIQQMRRAKRHHIVRHLLDITELQKDARKGW